MAINIEVPGGGSVSGTATNHAVLTNLDFASAGHTGFEGEIATGTTAQFYRGDKTFALVPDTGTNCPVNATYIVQTASATLTNEQALADLNTGILKSTSGTGLVSIAVSGTDYESPIATGTSTQILHGDKTFSNLVDNDVSTASDLLLQSVSFIIDGGGSAITTGIKGDLEIPYNCVIRQGTMLADQSGSIVVDIWKDTLGNFPPTDADSITSNTPLTISTATSVTDTALSGWVTTINAHDILRFNVDSAATVQRCLVALKVRKV